MKKIIALVVLLGSFLFGAMDLQTATKEELMSIKGIGEKKALQILEYRKTNKINSPEDLKNIKGFGDSIVSNVKANNLVKEKSLEVETKKENVSKKVEEKATKIPVKN